MQIYPLYPGLWGESNTDSRGLENEVFGRQDEEIYLVRRKEATEMHGNTLQNVRKDITKKETHTAVL